ncbi:MAG: hypothetical protein IT306_25900 [Chloroflexi bacterium]|nr:hypothetical protein [Chloroflexota bacterium]
MATATIEPTPRRSAGGISEARDAAVVMWLAFWTMMVSVSVGLPWDASWHIRNRFETPFSAPHLLVYATTGLTCGLVLALLTVRRLRRPFGEAWRVPLLPIRIPGPLLLVAAGLLVLALGAALDAVWHTAFGLDETRWSTPHAMIGWGWALAAFGFVSARLALGKERPVRWWTRAFLALVLLGFSAGPMLGPFLNNHSVDKVRLIAATPVLQAQAEYQHTVRIYLDWQLVRTNALFVVLGSLWAGLIVGVLRALDSRARFLLLLAAFWTVTSALRDCGTATRLGIPLTHYVCWAPIPLLPAVAAWLGVGRVSARRDVAAGLAGAVFGLCCQLIWPSPGPVLGSVLGPILGAGAGALCWLAGERLAETVAAALLAPSQRRCAIMAVVAVGAPLATGVADLILRSQTPWG